MKNLILLLVSTFCFGQQSTIEKLVILDARDNDKNITEYYLPGGYIVFYYRTDGELSMATVVNKSRSQSYGRLSTKSKTTTVDKDGFRKDVQNYKWSYENSYNNKVGTASVRVEKVYKPQGVAFICKIVLENMDILMYSGYKDGTQSEEVSEMLN